MRQKIGIAMLAIPFSVYLLYFIIEDWRSVLWSFKWACIFVGFAAWVWVAVSFIVEEKKE